MKFIVNFIIIYKFIYIYIRIKKKSGLNGVNGLTNHSISATDMLDIWHEQCLKRCFESRNHWNGSIKYWVYTRINEIYRIYKWHIRIYNSTVAGHTPYLSVMQHVLSFTNTTQHAKLINSFNHRLKANIIKIFLCVTKGSPQRPQWLSGVFLFQFHHGKIR